MTVRKRSRQSLFRKARARLPKASLLAVMALVLTVQIMSRLQRRHPVYLLATGILPDQARIIYTLGLYHPLLQYRAPTRRHTILSH